jgi:alkanesulfonate monooxygenase SsuD/methylene tetrahydromethanopterin reductase-like flavin-dependent oxidoreductase (luciferase family)
VALASADTFALIGGMGYPVFVSANTPTPQLRERLAQYRQAWREAGHSGPPDVALRIPAYVAETAERARSEPEATTMHAIRYGASELSPSAANQEIADRLQRMASVPYDDILKQRLMYGTPEAVTERLQHYHEELGISSVVLEMNYGGQLPYDRVINSIRLLTEKVIPKFK